MKNKIKGWVLPLAGLVLFFLFWIKPPWQKPSNRQETANEARPRQGPVSNDPGSASGFVRDTAQLIFSRHAGCRMDCRQISREEVVEILREGRINYSKSDMRADPDPKYALEDYSSDGQHLRIIFAPTRRGIVVVTCIDLDRDWPCNCN